MGVNGAGKTSLLEVIGPAPFGPSTDASDGSAAYQEPTCQWLIAIGRPSTADRVPGLARIVAFRNVLVHGYVQIDDALVWEAPRPGPGADDCAGRAPG